MIPFAVLALVFVALYFRKGSDLIVYKGEEKLADVNPLFRNLIDEWKTAKQTFPIQIDDGLRKGVEAELAQKSYFAKGMSKAKTLRETPHGRGAAIDIRPVSFTPAMERLAWPDVPEKVKTEFYIFGLFAENRGFKWGGRWRNATFPYGDQRHIEIVGWERIPFV